MSDTNTTPESGGTAPETVDTTPEPTEATQGDKAAREAAKYRRKLREVEAERDRLAAQVEAMQRAEIERLSDTKHHVRGEALWAAGYQVSDLIDDEGRPDESKVAVAAAETAERFGINRLGGAYVPAEGKVPPVKPTATWGNLLHPHRP